MATSIDAEFERRTDPHRRELLAHCYRMLGSIHDAEDLLQETLLRAWRAYDRFDDHRASLRTWLYRIATNACLTALEGRSRRPLPSGLGAPSDDPTEPLIRGVEVPWLQPFPDTRSSNDPAARGSMRLAFVAAMQLLPARQRAILILRDVLELPAAEVAETLGTTVAAVNSGLQRARAKLDDVVEDQVAEPADRDRRALVDRYVTAFENADVIALTRLLTDDVVLEMPPMRNWYLGRADYGRFMARVFEVRGPHWRMIHTSANGQPALAAYARADDGEYHLHTLQVLTVTTAGISHNVVFQDEKLSTTFALPSTVPIPHR
ncbi:MAG TPA: sigma-70 family RNA polymerase sigma factor [Pseudonocardiaceae bacterium]|nr:sigma-70 family RNA polymerase sigma factor [Pseudonocardiaceae bacterium]